MIVKSLYSSDSSDFCVVKYSKHLSKMPVRVNSSKEKKPEQVKLVWPGHLEQGRVGRIEEELRKEDIEPYKDDSPRFCRVSTKGVCAQRFF